MKLSKRVELIASGENYVSSSGLLLDPFILSCKGVFTRICVLYYLGPILVLKIWVVTFYMLKILDKPLVYKIYNT